VRLVGVGFGGKSERNNSPTGSVFFVVSGRVRRFLRCCSAGVCLGAGEEVNCGVAVGGAAVSCGVAVGDAAVSSCVGVGNSLALGVATIDNPIVAGQVSRVCLRPKN